MVLIYFSMRYVGSRKRFKTGMCGTLHMHVIIYTALWAISSGMPSNSKKVPGEGLNYTYMYYVPSFEV